MNAILFVATLALITCGSLAARRKQPEPAFRPTLRLAGSLLLGMLACWCAMRLLADQEHRTGGGGQPWNLVYEAFAPQR